jgi:hypothetical protein
MNQISIQAPIVTPIQSLLLSTEHAAQHIGITPHTLTVWRCTKRQNIPYIKVGRLVKYRLADLEVWLETRMISNATQSEAQ